MNDAASKPTPQKAAEPAPVATAEEVSAFRSEQEEEWGQYIAIADISHNGARAYNAGDPVPASNVERYGYLDDKLVAETASKEGGEVIRALHSNTMASPALATGPVVNLAVTVPDEPKRK